LRLALALVLSAVDLVLVAIVSLVLLALASDAKPVEGAVVLLVLALAYPVGMVFVGRGLAGEWSGYPLARRLLAASSWLLLPSVIVAVMVVVGLLPILAAGQG
jgi:hypothetical protein